MNEAFKFELGQTVKDIVTGFKGVIIGRTQYLTTCNTYGISPRDLTKEGKRPEWEWFDEPRLKLEKDETLSLVEPEKKKTGGPSNRSEIAPER